MRVRQLVTSAPSFRVLRMGAACRALPAAGQPRSWVEIATRAGVTLTELLRSNPGSELPPMSGLIYLPPCYRGQP